jgi:hypothetical protein
MVRTNTMAVVIPAAMMTASVSYNMLTWKKIYLKMTLEM